MAEQQGLTLAANRAALVERVTACVVLTSSSSPGRGTSRGRALHGNAQHAEIGFELPRHCRKEQTYLAANCGK